MGYVFATLIVLALIGMYLRTLVRNRLRMQRMNEPPPDMRRAGEDTRPPFDGRGNVIL